MRKNTISALALIFLCTTAHAQRQAEWFPLDAYGRLFSHNNSTVMINEDYQKVEITYLFPRSELYSLRVGVDQGVILFQGWKNQQHIEGFASVFSPCFGETRYKVAGYFNIRRTELRLHGPAPVINPHTCAVHMRTQGGNADLVFYRDERPVVE